MSLPYSIILFRKNIRVGCSLFNVQTRGISVNNTSSSISFRRFCSPVIGQEALVNNAGEVKEKKKRASKRKEEEQELKEPQVEEKASAPPNEKIERLHSFSKLGLSKVIVRTLEKQYPQIKEPTEIQKIAIPAILKGKKHVFIGSETGSGKTFAYLLPLINNIKKDEIEKKIETIPNHPRAIVLVPNRELCDQVLKVCKSLSHGVKFRSMEVVGGLPVGKQKEALSSQIDIVVGTPLRILHLKEKGFMYFSQLKYVVADEVDTFLTKDFKEDFDNVLKRLPTSSKKLPDREPPQLIFSGASLNKGAENELLSRFPKINQLKSKSFHKIYSHLEQTWIKVGGQNKLELLHEALRKTGNPPKPTMIFCNTIQSCQAVGHFLQEKGYGVACFHGDVPFQIRMDVWQSFVNGQVSIAVCTDIASRGLDTHYVGHVILFDFALNPIDYLHRIGRSTRGTNAFGKVTNLLTKRDLILANAIQKAIQNGQPIESLSSDKSDYDKEGNFKRFNKR